MRMSVLVHYGFFRRNVSSRSCGFLLVSFQKTKPNEKTKKMKKENYKKNQVMKMNKMKTKLKQNGNKNKMNKIKK